MVPVSTGGAKCGDGTLGSYEGTRWQYASAVMPPSGWSRVAANTHPALRRARTPPWGLELGGDAPTEGIRPRCELPFLRDVTTADIERFFEHQLDPAANWMAASTAENPSDRDAFEARWKRTLEDPSVIARTIVSGTEAVGYVATFLRNGTREVAYWLGRAHWGRGIASSAVAQFLGEVEARPLVARAVRDNVASLRVLEKCGFRRIGEDRFFSSARNVEVEEVVLALPPPDP